MHFDSLNRYHFLYLATNYPGGDPDRITDLAKAHTYHQGPQLVLLTYLGTCFAPLLRFSTPFAPNLRGPK